MLVLSRHKNEAIVINHDIIVTVIDIKGDKVRIGIEADSSIPVHRQEVEEAIQQQNRSQAMTALESVDFTAPQEDDNGK